jgi:hypothetical protein
MADDLRVEVVRIGTWLYDGTVPTPVRILRQNWDYYYEKDFDEEPPSLNAEGCAFYVAYGEPWVSSDGWNRVDYPSRSRTCLSAEEAVELATATLGQSIVWTEPPF